MFTPGQRFRTNSLFMKLLIHFLIIIILLASYNLWSLNLYSKNAEREIINHNVSLLKNTSETLEGQFRSLKGLMFTLYQDNRVKALYRQSLTGDKRNYDYIMIDNLLNKMRTDIANPHNQLENLMVYYPSGSFLLEKDGVVSEDSMFNRFYVNSRYSARFWKRNWEESHYFSIFPAASFYNDHTRGSQTLLPLTAQTLNGDYHIIAFVQVNRLLRAYSGTPQSDLLMLDADGKIIFSSTEEAAAPHLPEWDGASQWLLHQDTYYFFEKGEETGATYVSVIPYKTMNSTLQRLNWMTVLLFGVTLLIGIVASFMFSRSIHRPVRDILAGFVQDRKPAVYQSKISEFNQIHDRLSGLFQERNQINHELNSSKSLLTNYGYITRFKKIDTGNLFPHEYMVGEGSFILVLYRLSFRQGAMDRGQLKPEKAAARIRELITLHIREAFPVSHTLQMENNEILSVIYSEERSDALPNSLGAFKQTFDRDHEYYLVTIAVSTVFNQSEDFGVAYEQTQMMARQARPVEETQIFWDLEQTEGHFMFTAEQEHEFFVNVQAGNDTYCIQLMSRILETIKKNRATSEQLARFAEWLVVKTWKTMELLKAPCKGSADEILTQLQDCVTTEQYQKVLSHFISDSVRTVKVKREEQYDIIEFVMNYLENHYEEDISLEMLADKLNMSATYLSGYIKEKTGHNFTEHLNRLRIRTAKELLEKPDLTIKEISERLGYSNSTSFIRMFKRWTGQPPGDYRKTLFFKNKQDR